MKIAVVIKECGLTRGGAERYAVRLLQRLVAAKHEVHLFANAWDPELTESVQCHFVPYIKKPLFLKAWSFARNAHRILTRYRFDLIYGLTQFVPLDIYRTGGGIYPAYLEARYPDPAQRRWKKYLPKIRAMLRLENKIIRSRRTYYFMANSHQCREELIRYYRVDPSRVEVIYNGIDFSLFHTRRSQQARKEIRAKLRLEPNEILLLFAGNGFRRKNLDTVLEMMKSLGPEARRFKVAVVGRGRIAHYRRKATQMGVEKQFVFLGPQSEIQMWYQGADALIHPALYDPCSNACLEALACGLPVLTTKKNGASHWIEHGKNGFVVEDPRDAQAFADVARRLLDPSLREKMRLAAPSSVRELSEENHFAALNTLFEKTLALKRKAEHLPVEPAFYAKS